MPVLPLWQGARAASWQCLGESWGFVRWKQGAPKGNALKLGRQGPGEQECGKRPAKFPPKRLEATKGCAQSPRVPP